MKKNEISKVSDLQTGMVIETASGKLLMVIRTKTIFIASDYNGSWVNLRNYNYDTFKRSSTEERIMRRKTGKPNIDIVAVYKCKNPFIEMSINELLDKKSLTKVKVISNNIDTPPEPVEPLIVSKSTIERLYGRPVKIID